MGKDARKLVVGTDRVKETMLGLPLKGNLLRLR
jgi:hypothetical protein